jgi:hypothetical protein
MHLWNEKNSHKSVIVYAVYCTCYLCCPTAFQACSPGVGPPSHLHPLAPWTSHIDPYSRCHPAGSTAHTASYSKFHRMIWRHFNTLLLLRWIYPLTYLNQKNMKKIKKSRKQSLGSCTWFRMSSTLKDCATGSTVSLTVSGARPKACRSFNRVCREVFEQCGITQGEGDTNWCISVFLSTMKWSHDRTQRGQYLSINNEVVAWSYTKWSVLCIHYPYQLMLPLSLFQKSPTRPPSGPSHLDPKSWFVRVDSCHDTAHCPPPSRGVTAACIVPASRESGGERVEGRKIMIKNSREKKMKWKDQKK